MTRTHIASAQFGQYAAQRPDIYLLIIREPQDNLRCTISPRLDIGAEIISLKTAAPKIDDLHLTTAVAFHQYILRL